VRAERNNWSRWFAWYPVIADKGPKGASLGFIPPDDKCWKWVWFEWVETKPRIASDGPLSWFRLPQ